MGSPGGMAGRSRGENRWFVGYGAIAPLGRGSAVARSEHFPQTFRHLFLHLFPLLFRLEGGGTPRIRHGFADRGDSILPTSLRSIEVWS